MIGRHTAAPLREPARWWADAVGTGAIGSLVVVLALWLHGTGLQALTVSGTSAATSLGRLTGLLASDLLLIQVFLMARVPWVERSFGQDRLTRWHRYAGFSLVLADARPHRADRRRVRRQRPHQRRVRELGADHHLSGDAARGGRYGPADRGGGAVHPGGPAKAALRVLASPAPVRLSGRGTGPAPPTVDGYGVSRLAGRPGLLVVRLPGVRRQRTGVPAGIAAVAQPPAPVAGAKGDVGGAGRVLGTHLRP